MNKAKQKLVSMTCSVLVMTGLPATVMAMDTATDPTGSTQGTDRGGVQGTDRGGRPESESDHEHIMEGTIALWDELIEALTDQQ